MKLTEDDYVNIISLVVVLNIWVLGVYVLVHFVVKYW